MVASPTPKPRANKSVLHPQRVDFFDAFSPELPLGVALSGGADSTALLVLCARRWPGRVVALHVNHGLQAAASVFESHCVSLCQQLGVALRVRKVAARAAHGQSPEDAARIARYAALDALARGEEEGDDLGAVKTVALAQHADDQAETLLLALSRGAGLPGLSAMPAAWLRSGVQYCRPLLGASRDEVRAWLEQQGIAFVEDPSNADERYTRNRIRHRVLPALESAFPQFQQTFARSASHCAQAQAVLDEVGASDLAASANAQGLPRIAALQGLSIGRQANVLRHWLKTRYAVQASTAQLEALQRQIEACTTRGHRIELKVGAGFVQRSGDALAWYNRRVLLPTN